MAQAVMERAPAATTARETPGRFRPSSRARSRLVAGALVALLGVLVNFAIYRGLNEKAAVLELARDVPAGTEVSAADFRSVRIGSDGSFRSVPAAAVSSVVGSFAKVRLVAGTLLAREALQPRPLVAPGAAVLAVTIPGGELPSGLRERSTVRLVVAGRDGTTGAAQGIVVGLPTPVAGGATNEVSLSVELPAADADNVASAEHVRVVLLAPGGGS
jgi:SAF domain